jgi:predicted HTH transcriptional regulator
MIDIQSIADLELLRESVDLECKLAVGRDGLGALPEDFWPTYSAFANTDGGVVVLGVREKQGQFTIEGIANIAKVRKELFDSLNNRQKVSANLLTDAHAREVV